jgi:hypothetical protein
MAGKGKDGWRAIAAEVAGTVEGYGLASIFKRLVRAPVAGVVELTEDPGYQGHMTFFSAALTISLSFCFLILPRLFGLYTGESAAVSNAAETATQTTIIQYIEVAVFVVAGFYLFRLAATKDRSPRDYFKFAMIGTGALLLLLISIVTFRILVILALDAALPEAVSEAIIESPVMILIANLATTIATIWYSAALNRRFWGLRWRHAVPIVLALTVLDVGVVAASKQVLETAPVKAMMTFF